MSTVLWPVEQRKVQTDRNVLRGMSVGRAG